MAEASACPSGVIPSTSPRATMQAHWYWVGPGVSGPSQVTVWSVNTVTSPATVFISNWRGWSRFHTRPPPAG